MSQQGILAGKTIARLLASGEIEISPTDPSYQNPSSWDIRLGGMYGCYRDEILDAKVENKIDLAEIPEEGLIIQPGELYLMHTLERIRADSYVPIIDGKSSIGR